MNEKKVNKQNNQSNKENNKIENKNKTSACGGKCKPEHREENCK